MELVLGRSGTSACCLQRVLDLGSYRTAWRMAGIVRHALLVVEWPLLTGEVELCDVRLASKGAKAQTVWLAIERRPAASGLIRAWAGSAKRGEDFRDIRMLFDVGATVITPPGCWYRELSDLGFRHRVESMGTANALLSATSAAAAFQRMLSGRRHHGVAAATLDAYLSEFVFRHNAAVLGWPLEDQVRRVMALLCASRSSA